LSAVKVLARSWRLRECPGERRRTGTRAVGLLRVSRPGSQHGTSGIFPGGPKPCSTSQRTFSRHRTTTTRGSVASTSVRSGDDVAKMLPYPSRGCEVEESVAPGRSDHRSHR